MSAEAPYVDTGALATWYLNEASSEDSVAFAARWQLVQRLRQHPLRTLDSLHLAIARDTASTVLATADWVMSLAATDLGFEVATFDASAD